MPGIFFSLSVYFRFDGWQCDSLMPRGALTQHVASVRVVGRSRRFNAAPAPPSSPRAEGIGAEMLTVSRGEGGIANMLLQRWQ